MTVVKRFIIVQKHIYVFCSFVRSRETVLDRRLTSEVLKMVLDLHISESDLI